MSGVSDTTKPRVCDEKESDQCQIKSWSSPNTEALKWAWRAFVNRPVPHPKSMMRLYPPQAACWSIARIQTKTVSGESALAFS